jgi:hypothetical protein
MFILRMNRNGTEGRQSEQANKYFSHNAVEVSVVN